LLEVVLKKRVPPLVATDFLVVPTVNFRLLFVFIVLGHDRRWAIQFNVTAHPTVEWTARQIGIHRSGPLSLLQLNSLRCRVLEVLLLSQAVWESSYGSG
jgi:hypothetical protein